MLAIILSRRDLRETDQVISCYSLEKGKIEALARGVKKITSKNSAHLEPFSLVQVEVADGKEIDHITKVQPVEYFKEIRQDLIKSFLAGRAVSLVDKLTDVGEKDEDAFFLLRSWLEFLKVEKKPTSVLLDGLILKLLSILGLRPEINVCVVCKKTSVTAFYFQGGGMVCDGCGQEKKRTGEHIIKTTPETRLGLVSLLEKDWKEINRINTSGLHDLVYGFTAFHSDKNIVDWHK